LDLLQALFFADLHLADCIAVAVLFCDRIWIFLLQFFEKKDYLDRSALGERVFGLIRLLPGSNKKKKKKQQQQQQQQQQKREELNWGRGRLLNLGQKIPIANFLSKKTLSSIQQAS
jgi:hypothetical protein